MKDTIRLILAILLCELVGVLGTPFTTAAIPTWYAALAKPAFSPPNWVFGPVWTILYALMGISLYLIGKKGWKKKVVRVAMILFFAQLGANFLWSLLFFGLRSPLLGLIDIGVLLILIMLTMRLFYPLSKLACFLLIPYLLWVSFATALNAAIMILNR